MIQNIKLYLLENNTGQIPGVKENPRDLTGDGFAKAKQSIKDFPEMLEVRTLVVVKHGEMFVVIGGNQRLRAMRDLDYDNAPVMVVDWTVDKINEFIIKDNIEYGVWNFDLLANEWDSNLLVDWGMNLPVDFGDVEEPLEGLTDEDAAPEPPELPKTKLGDIYILGSHRLMCGDSTSIDAVEKLMDGKKADMVFTDHPYNVAIKGKFTGGIKNDDLSDKEFQDLLDGVASIIYQFNKGSSYIAYEIKNHTQFESAFSAVGEVSEIIVWNKDSASFYSDNKYNRKFEAILFIKGNGLLDCSAEVNVWDFAKSSSFNSRDENGKRFNEKGNYLVAHPTTKPVGLVERALKNSSKKLDLVLDTFGGSGSTLIACEKIGRKNTAMSSLNAGRILQAKMLSLSQLSRSLTSFNMQKYIKNYMKARNLAPSDIVACECCGSKIAADIHHIVFRSHGGTDDYSNLIALDRDCHRMAHSSKEFNEKLKQIASIR